MLHGCRHPGSGRDQGRRRVRQRASHRFPRAGESIQLVAPFGAAFVAWGDANDVQAWLEQADPPLSPGELDLYVNALDAVRNRGYSVTVTTDRQPDLIDALERLVEDHRSADSLRARDEVVRHFAHSDYLTRDLDFVGGVHLVHVSAPVFDSEGVVGATIMLLGPTRELAAAEIRDPMRPASDRREQHIGE